MLEKLIKSMQVRQVRIELREAWTDSSSAAHHDYYWAVRRGVVVDGVKYYNIRIDRRNQLRGGRRIKVRKARHSARAAAMWLLW